MVFECFILFSNVGIDTHSFEKSVDYVSVLFDVIWSSFIAIKMCKQSPKVKNITHTAYHDKLDRYHHSFSIRSLLRLYRSSPLGWL